MTATERFFEMARKKAKRIVYATGKPFDAAISKKRPSLRVALWRASASLSRLQRVRAICRAPCLADCRAITATQTHKILVSRGLPTKQPFALTA